MIHTRNEVYEKVKKIYEKFGYLTFPLIESNSDISRRHIRTTFKTLNDLKDELGAHTFVPRPPSPIKGKKKKPTWSKEKALSVIKTIESKYGYFSKAMTEKGHPAVGQISGSVIVRIWGNFTNLYEQESIKSVPKKAHPFKDQKVLIESLKEFYKEDKILNAKTVKEFCKYNHFSLGSFYKSMTNLSNVSLLIGKDYCIPFTKIESAIIGLLSKELGDNYIKEFKDDDIKSPISGRHYPIDFFFSEYNLCVEVNGQQHYEYIEFFHRTQDNFEKRRMRDHLKYNLIRTKYKLLIIKYNDCETTILNNLKLTLAMN